MYKGFAIFYGSVILVICIVFGYFYYTLSSENKRIKETFNSQINSLKIEKDSIINASQNRIDSVSFLNIPLLSEIARLKLKLDSVSRVKQSIRIIYKDKLKEIDTFENTDILNYWKDEFNN